VAVAAEASDFEIAVARIKGVAVPIAQGCPRSAGIGKPLWLVDWCGKRRYAPNRVHDEADARARD
jgi:hypothetical protein